MGKRPKPLIKRLIVVGFDGQEPKLTDRFMKEGKLPNYKRLAEMGCYHRLATTYPSVSPVAWSSFSTGTPPPKHNIYDFLDRDPRTYLPLLSSAHIGNVDKFLKIGRFRIPLRKPEIRLLRKSKPLWTFLGERNIWSTILRVPITFPPDRFYGAQLSAMCVPDLLGTQGTFLYFSTRPPKGKIKEGGSYFQLKQNGNGYETAIQGPPNTFLEDNPPLEIPLKIDLDREKRLAHIGLNGHSIELAKGEFSDWINLSFKAAPGVKVSGICRMKVMEMDEHFSLYVTPLNIDPEKPAMPISHPSYYSAYLAKRLGPYATLGLAEDTWALDEGLIDEKTFLEQAYDIDEERRSMFFNSWDKMRKGTLVCVFDATDRVQHMFWRYLEKGHPAAEGWDDSPYKDAIEKLYIHNDKLVGKVLDRLEEGDLLMVISDHGFTSFRRGGNLNAWLHANGYLTLKEGTDGSSEWLRDVDWSKTKAYCLGLTGLYLNIKGRESEGIVAPGAEAKALKKELISKLNGLMDEERGVVGIREVFDTPELYKGPYLENAPDLLLGFNAGYRVSWDCATGMVSGPVFEDNRKCWSGDHCVDPRLVPGIFLSNVPIDKEDPALMDVAPTALELFGLNAPAHMEGKQLFDKGRFGNGSRGTTA
jgi:predicted AlkP superfamily phosphohydrolase/phosphomutase